jgi:hypothetical protein
MEFNAMVDMIMRGRGEVKWVMVMVVDIQCG